MFEPIALDLSSLSQVAGQPLLSGGPGADPAYGVLGLAAGGTGAQDAAGARAALGLAIGVDVLAPTGSGAGLTDLDASRLASGTVPPAALGTGTPALGTYVDGGTGAWTALPAATPGGADGSLQYSSGGAFAGFGKWDGLLLAIDSDQGEPAGADAVKPILRVRRSATAGEDSYVQLGYLVRSAGQDYGGSIVGGGGGGGLMAIGTAGRPFALLIDGAGRVAVGSTSPVVNATSAFMVGTAGGSLGVDGALSGPVADANRGQIFATNNFGSGTAGSLYLVGRASPLCGVAIAVGAAAATTLACNGSAYTTLSADAAANAAMMRRAAGARVYCHERDAVTAAASEVARLYHESTGTAGAGFGARLGLSLDSSTTKDRLAAAIEAAWSNSTDASRLADLILWSSGYNGDHEAIRFRDTGAISQPIIPLANLRDAADDAAAAALTPAVPVGGLYRTGGTLKIRTA